MNRKVMKNSTALHCRSLLEVCISNAHYPICAPNGGVENRITAAEECIGLRRRASADEKLQIRRFQAVCRCPFSPAPSNFFSLKIVDRSSQTLLRREGCPIHGGRREITLFGDSSHIRKPGRGTTMPSVAWRPGAQRDGRPARLGPSEI